MQRFPCEYLANVLREYFGTFRAELRDLMPFRSEIETALTSP
jgi:hypothetical protein